MPTYSGPNTQRSKKKYKLKNKYNMSLEEWDKLYEEQDGKCFLCLEVKPLCVDHCHKTGKIRHLLCRQCNAALGMLKENKNTVKRILNYLD